MRFDMRCGTALASLGALLIAALLLTTGPVWAKKPVKPPPEPPPAIDGGTIYFAGGGSGGMNAMAPDGSGKTALSSAIYYDAEPSAHLHDGRWFLQIEAVAGATYPSTVPTPRLELFAVHESGSARVLLTDGRIAADTFLEPNCQGYPDRGYLVSPRWTDDDTVVSYKALRTRYVNGVRTILAGGIYTLTVDPDALGEHEPVAMGADPLMALPWDADFECIYGDYDWRPDGGSILYWVVGLGGLFRADASTGWIGTCVRTGPAAYVRWSPAGDRILFRDGPTGDIRSMAPDGSGERVIVADPEDKKKRTTRVWRASWSPAGSHVVYEYDRGGELHRVTADGADETNLTGDVDADCIRPKWRGE